MSRRRLPYPTGAELEILKIIWRLGKATVNQIRDQLETSSGAAGVGKVIQIMKEKKLVWSDEAERAHVYHALVKEDEVQREMASGLVDKVFSGSKSQLVQRIFEAGKTSPEEMAEIRRLIKQQDKG